MIPSKKNDEENPARTPESMEEVSEEMNAKLQRLEDEAHELQVGLSEADKKSDDLRRRLLNDAPGG